MREIVQYCYGYSCFDWEKLWDEAEKKLRKDGSRNALDPLLQKIGKVVWATKANDLFQNSNLQARLHYDLIISSSIQYDGICPTFLHLLPRISI